VLAYAKTRLRLRSRGADQVTTLVFDCVGARAEPYAAAPTLAFGLRIAETTGTPVHAVALRCQLRLEPQQRRYTPAEQERLRDLFGDPSRWADTVKPIQFTTVTAMVPGFTGALELDLPVPCTYDLEIAATRYFHALDKAEIPMLMLFSGTIFGRSADGGLAVEPVPWSAECRYRLPVAVWREMVDRYFPGCGWLRLRRETLSALAAFKSREALPTWEATIDALLVRQRNRTEVGHG
jgi:hypothetical protein